MTHVKSLSIQGFKSFAPKTEINFDTGINTIVGPNGSGKSNISDALCFVLGRLSAKSMRAAKAKNLLFLGSKYAKPAQEASVEIKFDNSKNTFALPQNEVALRRIVRRNGQSIYQINGETKTRTEVLETLAHAGIDPNGFNIILQGNIASLVKSPPEERRRMLEEVSGISVYETRKEKSFKELEKTEARLKEIETILRERTSFMRNLENERAQALKFKSLESTIKRCKASILNKRMQDKHKEIQGLQKSIDENLTKRGKMKASIEKNQMEIDSLNEKINSINKHIQKSTGLEQESLHTRIADLKAEISGLEVRRESYENRFTEVENRIDQMQNQIPELEAEINDLRRESPLVAKKQQELQKKKQELEKIQEEKKSIYTTKSQLSAVRDRIKDKEQQLAKVKAESESLLSNIDSISEDLKHEDSRKCEASLENNTKKLQETKENLQSLTNEKFEHQKLISISESKIQDSQAIKGKVDSLDLCPLCQTKITKEHINHVFEDCDSKIQESQAKIKESQKALQEADKNYENLTKEIESLTNSISRDERELSLHVGIAEKTQTLKKYQEEKEILETEISTLLKNRDSLESKSLDSSRIEEAYSSKLHEIEEISSRTEESIDSTLAFKERELEKTKEIIKQSHSSLDEIQEYINDISQNLESKSQALEMKEKEEQELNEKFKKLFKDRDSLQEEVKEKGFQLTDAQTNVAQVDEQINYLKVGFAKLDAEKEAIEMELKDFSGVELIKAPAQAIEDRLVKAQDSINKIGAINLKALEVYDQVKEEYDKVKERSDHIEKEKDEILRIIEEIDKKKKRTFMKTFNAINEIFSENFARLYTKGKAYLELENKQDPFEAGIDIVIKLAKGKYFDLNSLSGGEQTMVAISLLFAIQEYKPYHFYIFDEIDAALDKRNSERLSALLKQYMQNGQYIVITHNDAIITDSDILYGVSMHDGISKILSMKLN